MRFENVRESFEQSCWLNNIVASHMIQNHPLSLSLNCSVLFEYDTEMTEQVVIALKESIYTRIPDG